MQPPGLLLALVSALFNGTFAGLSKLPSAKLVHPIVFNLYCSVGVFLSSMATAAFLPLVGARLQFTPAGALGGLIFVGASSLSFVAASTVGLSTGQGVWGGSAILVSFAWGTLGPPAVSRAVADLPLSLLAVLLLVMGVVGIVQCERLGALASRLLASSRRTGRTEPLVMSGTDDPRHCPSDADEFDGVAPSTSADAKAAGARLAGLAAAVAVGLFGGSILVPLSFLGAEFQGAKSLAFLPSFGVGSLGGASLLTAIWWARRSRQPGGRPSLGRCATLLAGMGSGLVWNLGNLCSILAMQFYGIPYGVAYPLLQASLVFGGLIGIVFFRELRGRPAIAAFFASAAVVLLGAILLGLFGPGAGAPLMPPAPSTPPLPSFPPSVQPPPSDPPPLSLLPRSPPAPSPSDSATVAALGRTLLQVVVIQGVGFALKATGVATPVLEAGIAQYVGLVAFPCVLFRAVVTLDADIPGLTGVTLAVLFAKSVVYALAFLLGAWTASPADGAGAGFTRGAYAGMLKPSQPAGLLGCFSTNSDDVGLGYPALKPVLSGLFPRQAELLYVLSAMQNLVFNPVTYVLLGIGEAKANAAREGGRGAEESCAGRLSPTVVRMRRAAPMAAVVLRVLFELRKNMLVVSVIAALVYRAALGASLPTFLDQLVVLLGTPFTPLVYVIGGFAFSGSSSCVESLQNIAMPLLLNALKSLITPVLARLAVHTFDGGHESAEVNDFVWIYGLLPCATSALVIARLHGASGTMIGLCSAYLSLNKLSAYVLIFLAAVIARVGSMQALLRTKADFSLGVETGSLLSSAWLVLTLACVPLWRTSPAMASLSAHFGLQLVYFTTFVIIVTATQASGGPPVDVPWEFRCLYASINVLRWAVDGSTLALAADWAMRERHGCCWAGSRRRHSALHLGCSLSFGLLLTVPWSAAMPVVLPMDLGIDWWLAYGTGQTLAYAIAYGALTIALIVCLLTVAARRRGKDHVRLDPSPLQDRPPIAADQTPLQTDALAENADAIAADGECEPEPGFCLRLGAVLVAAAIRFAGHTGICACVAARGFNFTGTLVELLLIMVAFEDGQGILCLLLFGLQPQNFKAIARRLRLFRRGRQLCTRHSCNSARESTDSDSDSARDVGEAVIAVYTDAYSRNASRHPSRTSRSV